MKQKHKHAFGGAFLRDPAKQEMEAVALSKAKPDAEVRFHDKSDRHVCCNQF